MMTSLRIPSPPSARRYLAPWVPACRWCGSITTVNNASDNPQIESLRLDAVEDGLPEDIRATVCDGCGNVALVGPHCRVRSRRITA